MDRRESNYPYPRRSNPPRKYSDYADDVAILSDSDDVIHTHPIAGVAATSSSSPSSHSSDEDYGKRRRNRGSTSNNNSNRTRRPRSSRHARKHRKLSAVTNYQFAAPTPTWNEKATFVLLEIWGDRFLQLGRSSLRSEDWVEVAERVEEATGVRFPVGECRGRLDALKVRYRREKGRDGGAGSGGGYYGNFGGNSNNSSKWVYFKKMDSLMTMSPMQLRQQEQCGLACGVDCGEFVFMNPKVYLDRSNVLDEMRDSPGEDETEDDDDDDDEEEEEEGKGVNSSDDDEEEEVGGYDEEDFRMLSESIRRVGEIYEKVEDRKREQMMELEKMRVEFENEMEVQKKELIERTRVEIERLASEGDDEEEEGDDEVMEGDVEVDDEQDSGCSAEKESLNA